jgi:hypothetical protein
LFTITLALLLVLLQVVEVANANPAPSGGYPKPSEAPQVFPTKITILSPTNGTNNASNTITFVFSVNAPESPTPNTTDSHLWWIYYRTDWLHDTKDPIAPSPKYECVFYKQNKERVDYKEFNITFEGVPEGNHTIEIYTTGALTYTEGQNRFQYSATSVASVYFIVDPLSNQISNTTNGLSISLMLASTGIIVVGLVLVGLFYFKRNRASK